MRSATAIHSQARSTANQTDPPSVSEHIVGVLGIISSKMSQSKDKILDARSLWVPVSVVIAMGAALVIAGMWIQQTNDNRTQTQDMEDKLDALISQQATMQGSLNALMEMQATLSKTAAEVGSLDSRMNAFETRIQTQDAWIQNTRQKMLEHGFRPPEYRSGDYKPGPPG